MTELYTIPYFSQDKPHTIHGCWVNFYGKKGALLEVPRSSFVFQMLEAQWSWDAGELFVAQHRCPWHSESTSSLCIRGPRYSLGKILLAIFRQVMTGCIALMQESLEPLAVVQTWFIRFVVYSTEGYEDEGTFLETHTHTCWDMKPWMQLLWHRNRCGRKASRHFETDVVY